MRAISAMQFTRYRWHKEYGGLKGGQPHWMVHGKT